MWEGSVEGSGSAESRGQGQLREVQQGQVLRLALESMIQAALWAGDRVAGKLSSGKGPVGTG